MYQIALIFHNIFYGYVSLKDIKFLENWNVSKGNNFSYMFHFCSSLSDIKSLENGMYQIVRIFQICFIIAYQ